MFGHDPMRDIRNHQGAILTLLGGALGATAFLTFRHCRKKEAMKGRERLGQAPSREHIRLNPGD
jgi:hypothetical protein